MRLPMAKRPTSKKSARKISVTKRAAAKSKPRSRAKTPNLASAPSGLSP